MKIKKEKELKERVLETKWIFKPPHPLTNFEIQKYYQNEPKFNAFFPRDNFPKKTRDGAYVINLDKSADVGTHWIALFCRKNEILYLILLVLNIFPKKLKNSLVIKT